MTRDEFVDMAMAEYEKKKQIEALNLQRHQEEEALATEYKVNECNTKRNAVVVKYQKLIEGVRNS